MWNLAHIMNISMAIQISTKQHFYFWFYKKVEKKKEDYQKKPQFIWIIIGFFYEIF
jgi:hypothetical protein